MSLFAKIRGTIETLFQLGIGGPQLKNNAGVVENRNSTDTDFAVVRGHFAAATIPGINDLVPFVRYQPAYYGDGSDGTATFDGTLTPAGSTKNSSTSYTLTRDVFYAAITVSSGVTVHTNGWRVFCFNTCNLVGVSSSLDNSGTNGGAGSSSAGTAGSGGACATLGSGVVLAGAGGGGGLAGAGSPGANFTNGNSWGGNSGAGGTGTTGAGGAAGINTFGATNNTTPPRQAAEIAQGTTCIIQNGSGVVIQSQRAVQGGAGGGGGGSGTGTGGGGGGGGGGVVIVCAKVITGNGFINANGGNGGAGGGSGAAQGGGGGGGFVGIIYTDISTWAGNPSASGGTGANAGVNGTTVLCQG